MKGISGEVTNATLTSSLGSNRVYSQSLRKRLLAGRRGILHILFGTLTSPSGNPSQNGEMLGGGGGGGELKVLIYRRIIL